MPIVPLQKLIVSAPFGNYIQPAGATATLGTFTAAPRPGRLWRILKTVRYYPRLKAWVNKIGLRNPGIASLAQRVQLGRIDVSHNIVSIHGFTEADWHTLLDRTAAIGPLAIELNMSCPNVGCIEWPADLFTRAVATGAPIIVKLPPVNYEEMFRQAAVAGVRAFHCCNTLPVPAGGVSGKPLKPVALQCIRDVINHLAPQISPTLAPDLQIIGGGGITTPQDIDDYIAAGVKHVAIGTKTFNPLCLVTHTTLRPLIDHAAKVLK